MQVQPFATFVHQSQAAVQVILGAQAVYQGLGRFAIAVRSTAVFIFIGLPAIAALWLLLRWIRSRLSKVLQTNVQISPVNYPQLRREYDALDSNRQKLQSLQSLDLKKIPWLLRGVTVQIKKIGDLNDIRLQAVGKALRRLDPKCTPSDYRLQPLSEDDLWQRRTKAYDYLA